jgi:hypothetical protein
MALEQNSVAATIHWAEWSDVLQLKANDESPRPKAYMEAVATPPIRWHTMPLTTFPTPPPKRPTDATVAQNDVSAGEDN